MSPEQILTEIKRALAERDEQTATEVRVLRAERTMYADLEDAVRTALRPSVGPPDEGAVAASVAELGAALDRLDTWRMACSKAVAIGAALEDVIGMATAGWTYASGVLRACVEAAGFDRSADRHMAEIPKMVEQLRMERDSLRAECDELRARLARSEAN